NHRQHEACVDNQRCHQGDQNLIDSMPARATSKTAPAIFQRDTDANRTQNRIPTVNIFFMGAAKSQSLSTFVYVEAGGQPCASYFSVIFCVSGVLRSPGGSHSILRSGPIIHIEPFPLLLRRPR